MTREHLGAAIGFLLSGAFLFFDYVTPLGVADGNLYVVVVVVGLLFRSERLVLTFGLVGIVFTSLGIALSPAGSSISVVLVNRGLAIFAILILTISGYVFLKMHAQSVAKLKEIAETDALTGVGSRRLLIKQLEDGVSRALRYDTGLAIILLDIDRFKQINDQHGHLCGDEVLKQVAAACATCVRKVDFLGRYGGDEFLIICPSSDAQALRALAERIRSAVGDLRVTCVSSNSGVTVSIGGTLLSDDVTSVNELMHKADSALFEAKNRGRNQVVITQA